MTRYDTSKRHNSYQLARMADVSDPDEPQSTIGVGYAGSPGARWLHNVEDDMAEAIAYWQAEAEPGDPPAYVGTDDMLHDIADGAVSIYTHERWVVFTDLALWQVDISELTSGDDASHDMTHMAGIAQYVAANTLAIALVEAWQVEGDDLCAEEGCSARLNDGEGWDGYCGSHADQRDA